MVCAKNYETMSTCVKTMQKKLWPLFSGHGVYGIEVEDPIAPPTGRHLY